MTSPNRIPSLPFDITDDIAALIGRMATLDPLNASFVEPALLASFRAVGDFIDYSSPSGSRNTLLAADVILSAEAIALVPLMPLFQTAGAAIPSLAEALHREVGQ